MKTTTLGEKLVLYFVLLGAGAILIIGAVAFYSTRKALIDRTTDQLTSLRIVKKNQVEQFYSDRIRDITFAVDRGCPDPQSPANLETLRSLLRILGRYYSAYYVTRGGDLTAGGSLAENGDTHPELPSAILRDLPSRMKDQVVWISDVVADARAGPRQFIAGRMKADKGKPSLNGDFTLVLEFDPGAIDAIMLNNDPQSGLGLSGETYLVGSDLLMRSSSRFQPGSILKTRARTAPALNALAGKTGEMTTRDYRDIAVISSFGRVNVQGLSWAILAEIDLKEAMVPVYNTRSRILMLSLLLMILFFGVVLFIANRITRPIVRLRDAAIRLGQGTHNIDLPVETRDEIGALTGAFNVMARQIREKTTELQQERSGRMRSVFDGEEMERQRLSRELHDGIGQSLIAVKLRLESLLYLESGDIRNSIQELRRYFDQIIDEVRRISNNLMPSVLEAFSIPIAFRNLFNETEEHSELKIHFEARGTFDDLDRKTKTYLYRLMQEALNNIVKHADAGEVWVNLHRSQNELSLVIRDNGKGFVPDRIGQEGGNGIHNMRERAGLLMGHLEIRSAPGEGTTITLQLSNLHTDVKNQDFPRG